MLKTLNESPRTLIGLVCKFQVIQDALNLQILETNSQLFKINQKSQPLQALRSKKVSIKKMKISQKYFP